MWQQLDCSPEQATLENPSGCRKDLFPWVETTIGAGNNGAALPANFTDESTGEGSTAMGFYNVQQGDAPYFKSLADTYAMSDNFHQSIEGGTGANHVALGTGDWPTGTATARATRSRRRPWRSEDPDPQTGTNNWYTQDGYSGGTYSDCSDPTQPGVGPVEAYLKSQNVKPNCEPGHYYLLNNYNPGYFGDGTVAVERLHHPAVVDAARSATSCSRTTSRGATTATSGTGTSRTRRAPTRSITTATSATPSSTPRRSWPTTPFARRT